MKYGLWLQPSGKSYQDLQNLIKELAEKFNGPVFEPHISLTPSFDNANLTKLNSELKKLAAMISSFSVQLEQINFSSTYFQNVFYSVESSLELLNLRMQANKLFPEKSGEPYFPHLSLIYGEHSAKQRQEILDYVKNKNLNFELKINSININSAGNDNTKTWKVIKKFNLN